MELMKCIYSGSAHSNYRLYYIISHFSSHISSHFLVLYNTSSRLVACTSHHPQGTKTTDLGKKLWGIWCHHFSEMVGYSLKLKHWAFPAFVFMEFTTSIYRYPSDHHSYGHWLVITVITGNKWVYTFYVCVYIYLYIIYKYGTMSVLITGILGHKCRYSSDHQILSVRLRSKPFTAERGVRLKTHQRNRGTQPPPHPVVPCGPQ